MKFFILLLLLNNYLFSQIIFDSNFESGNLKSVTTTDSINFVVTTNEDIGGRWFYFRISGVENKFISVEVSNSDCRRPFYSYDNENFTRFTAQESPSVNYFQKTFEEDTVYISYYVPYNYSFLKERLNEWKNNQNAVISELGTVMDSLMIYEIRITDYSVPDSSKKRVWIHSRTHPGETPSSWHFDGIVETLLKNDPVISELRKNVIFHLIPFTNPAGVYFGRSRTNFDYIDLESNWNKPDNETTEEVKILKARMSEICDTNIFEVALNLHSIASPSCTFFIHTANSTSNQFYLEQLQFANLQTSDNPYFSHSDYSFSNLQPYFPEGWLWNNYGEEVLALTYETPYSYYSNNEWVTNDNLRIIGERTVYAIMEYLGINTPEYFISDNLEADKIGTWETVSIGNEFFNDNFNGSLSGNGENKILYDMKFSREGNYKIHSWYPSSATYSQAAEIVIKQKGYPDDTLFVNQTIGGGEWHFLKEVAVTDSSVILEVNNNNNALVVADAFRVIFIDEITEIKRSNHTPSNFYLKQNFPNPFNGTTEIQFSIRNSSSVKLSLFNQLGEHIVDLVNGYFLEGEYSVKLNTEDFQLASGTYFYRIENDYFSETKQMMLLK